MEKINSRQKKYIFAFTVLYIAILNVLKFVTSHAGDCISVRSLPTCKKRPHSRQDTLNTKRAKRNDILTEDVEEKLSINQKSSSETEMQWDDYEHLEHVPLAQLRARKTVTAKRHNTGTKTTTQQQGSSYNSENLTFDDMVDSATSSPSAPTTVDTTVELDSSSATPNTTVNLADNSAEFRVVTPIASPAVSGTTSLDTSRGEICSLIHEITGNHSI